MTPLIFESEKDPIRNIIQFAKALQLTRFLCHEMRDKNEHLEYFIEHGVDISAFYKLDLAIREIERSL